MELTRELDLGLDLGKALDKHRVGEWHANFVLATLVSVVLVLLVWPNDTVIENFSVAVVNIQLNSISAFCECLVVEFSDLFIQDVNRHLESLEKQN